MATRRLRARSRRLPPPSPAACGIAQRFRHASCLVYAAHLPRPCARVDAKFSSSHKEKRQPDFAGPVGCRLQFNASVKRFLIADVGDYGNFTAMNQGQTQEFFDAQRIRAGEVYTTNDIVKLLKVSKKTVTSWYSVGLEYTPISLHPSAKRFVSGSKLIEFLGAYGLALRILSLMRGSHAEEEANEEEETA